MLAQDVEEGLGELALPEGLSHVQDYLHDHDPDLRLRCSAERPGFFVLERRCRRAPAINTGMRSYTDIHVQARDGYIHVSLVHLEWLLHPWNIPIALREEGYDTWAYRNWDQVVDELEYEEAFVKETRRRRTREDARDHYREEFDILSRLGNGDGTEVTRFRNPGLPAPGAGTEGVSHASAR